jgi:hypothetical protein
MDPKSQSFSFSSDDAGLRSEQLSAKPLENHIRIINIYDTDSLDSAAIDALHLKHATFGGGYQERAMIIEMS